MSISSTKLPNLSKSLRDSELEIVKNTFCLLSFTAIHPSRHTSYSSLAIGYLQRVFAKCPSSSKRIWLVCFLRVPAFGFSAPSLRPSQLSLICCPSQLSLICCPSQLSLICYSLQLSLIYYPLQHVPICYSSDSPQSISFRISLLSSIARS